MCVCVGGILGGIWIPLPLPPPPFYCICLTTLLCLNMTATSLSTAKRRSAVHAARHDDADGAGSDSKTGRVMAAGAGSDILTMFSIQVQSSPVASSGGDDNSRRPPDPFAQPSFLARFSARVSLSLLRSSLAFVVRGSPLPPPPSPPPLTPHPPFTVPPPPGVRSSPMPRA